MGIKCEECLNLGLIMVTLENSGELFKQEETIAFGCMFTLENVL